MTMNKTVIVALLAASAGVLNGCDKRDGTTTTPSGATTSPSTTKDADNTDRNKRDRDMDATKTPLDQSQSAEDVKITAEIRKAILDDKSMSMNGQNVKIITDKSGVVTLRGPVDSQAEKDAIEAKAKAVAGVTRVDNQLEVKAH